MFEQLMKQVEGKGEVVQVSVPSEKMIPSIEVVDDKRVLFLKYEDHKYQCMEKGWVSWAERVLVPDIDARKRHGVYDNERNKNRRWSIGTVRSFLNMTPTEIANDAVVSWWKRHPSTDWNIIKYADTDKGLGRIRYIGSSRYNLYRHQDFLSDLSSTDLGSLRVRDSVINENRMVVRITKDKPIKIDGANIFAGFHLYNSENGSSSIGIKHLIFDQICTNGMIIVLDSNQILNQRHSRFDVDEFRNRVVDISKFLPQIHDSATEMVSRLVNIKLNTNEIEAVMRMYKDRFDASNKFIEEVGNIHHTRYSNTAWGVISSITEISQKYNWETRMLHEENASEMVKLIENKAYGKYLTKNDENDENDEEKLAEEEHDKEELN